MQIFNYLEFIKEALIDYDQDLIRIFSTLTKHHDKDVANVANNLIDICHTEIDSRTLRNPEYKLRPGSTEQSISLDGKNEIRIGRLVGILLPKVPDHIKGKFASAFMVASSPQEQKDEFEIITGEDIKQYYKSNNCILKGTLASSCMLDAKDILDIYCKNPDKVSLVIYKEKGSDKISGRALLWTLYEVQTTNTEKHSHLKFVDRIYYSSDDIIDKFIDWAKEKDYLFRRYQSNETKTILDKSGQEHSDIAIGLKNFEFKSYPYLDTLYFLDMTNGIIRQKLSGREKVYYQLNHTGGFYDAVDNSVFRVLADHIGSPIGLLRRRGATLIDIYANQADMESLDNIVSTWAVKSTKQMEVDVRNYYYENSEEYEIDYNNYIPNDIPQKVIKQVADKLISDMRNPEAPNSIKTFKVISEDCSDQLKEKIKESARAILNSTSTYDKKDIEKLLSDQMFFGEQDFLYMDHPLKLSDFLISIYHFVDRRSSMLNAIINKIDRDSATQIFEKELQSNRELVKKICSIGESWVFDGAINWPDLVTNLVDEQWTSTEHMFKILYFTDLDTSVTVDDTEYLLGKYKGR